MEVRKDNVVLKSPKTIIKFTVIEAKIMKKGRQIGPSYSYKNLKDCRTALDHQTAV